MKKLILCIFPLLVFLICGGLSALNYVKIKDTIDYQKTFKSTTAVVVDKRIIIDTNGLHAITFDYEVDGKAYTGKIHTKQHSHRYSRTPSFARKIYHVGDVTTIWYDPADPTIIRGGKPSPWLDIFMPMVVGMTMVVLYIAALIRVGIKDKKKKKKEKSKDGRHHDDDDDDDDDDHDDDHDDDDDDD